MGSIEKWQVVGGLMGIFVGLLLAIANWTVFPHWLVQIYIALGYAKIGALVASKRGSPFRRMVVGILVGIILFAGLEATFQWPQSILWIIAMALGAALLGAYLAYWIRVIALGVGLSAIPAVLLLVSGTVQWTITDIVLWSVVCIGLIGGISELVGNQRLPVWLRAEP